MASQSAQLSDGLTRAILEAVRRGLELLRDGASPLQPLLLTWRAGVVFTDVLLGESVEDSVAFGRETAWEAPKDVTHCVLLWDGYITTDGVRSEALFLQAQERGRPESHVFVQRYSLEGAERLTWIGNPSLLRSDKPLLGE
jgi:hypothetical protein